jgi:hypothetical protein
VNTVAANFIDECSVDPRFAGLADQIEAALNAIDIEADYNVHATVFYEAIGWVLSHENRPLPERFLQLWKLINHSGAEIEMHEFTGWNEQTWRRLSGAMDSRPCPRTGAGGFV